MKHLYSWGEMLTGSSRGIKERVVQEGATFVYLGTSRKNSELLHVVQEGTAYVRSLHRSFLTLLPDDLR